MITFTPYNPPPLADCPACGKPNGKGGPYAMPQNKSWGRMSGQVAFAVVCSGCFMRGPIAIDYHGDRAAARREAERKWNKLCGLLLAGPHHGKRGKRGAEDVRIIDVLEGRQPLGNLETKGEAK